MSILEQESEWTSPHTSEAVPLTGQRRGLRSINGSSGWAGGSWSDRRGARGGPSGCGRAWLVMCSLITFIFGACAAGFLVWWRYEQIFERQEEHIRELRKAVEGLMTGPMADTEAHSLDKSVYVQELWCKQTWRRQSQYATTISSTPRSKGIITVTAPPFDHKPNPACVRTCSLQERKPEQAAKRWAYVMLSQNVPGNAEHLWGVVAVASALRRLGSNYPVVLLTNTTKFPDGTSVTEALRKLNVVVRPVYEVEMPMQHRKKLMYQHWRIAYWKLQIWGLEDYEKLIWLDSDTILYRNIDWLFDRPWMWAQRDDWFCKLNVTKVCSGIVLLYPNRSDYSGLLSYAEEMGDLKDGDQQLISRYFAVKRKMAINLLSDIEASFGQCIGKAPAPYINKDGSQVWGVWNIPSFVHKSGGWGNTNGNLYSNVCFMPNITMQLYRDGDATLNVCQYHPLGPYWRGLFCDAIATMGLKVREVDAFCNDECWYSGRPESAWSQPGGLEAGQWHMCGVVNGTLNYVDYYSRKVGFPLQEMRKQKR